MNRENILTIARALIAEDTRFDMLDTGYNRICKSAGCIAGHIAYHREPNLRIIGCGDIPDIMDFFEIPYEHASRMFTGQDYPSSKVEFNGLSVLRLNGSNRTFFRLRYITRWTAAAMLARYCESETVDFSETPKNEAIDLVRMVERKYLLT